MVKAMPRAPNSDRHVALFLDMLAAERGAGINTLSAYTRDLDDLALFLKQSRRAILSADTDVLRRYLAALADRGLKASSVARRLSAIRQLYRFLYAEGHRGDDPAAVIEGPKRGRALPKVLTIAEVDRLLSAARASAEGAEAGSSERLRALRLVCILEVLYATGLRVSELIALPASAARRDDRMLVIVGKGGRERLAPLNTAAKIAMRDYLAALG
jgi:integrase/recombinase XerD